MTTVTEVEDFKSATVRLLSKLPRIDGIDRREGLALPRLEIEAGPLLFLAFAADAGSMTFHGLVQIEDRAVSGRWVEYAIDADGHVVLGGQRHRIRRIELETGEDARVIRSWPEFARARKVRSPM